MYGVDVDDLDFPQEKLPLAEEEDHERHAAVVSNPWTIARMNAAIKPKTFGNGQLLSPAQSRSETLFGPSSPAKAIESLRPSNSRLMTPQLSPTGKLSRDSLESARDEGIQELSRPLPLDGRFQNEGDRLFQLRERDQFSISSSPTESSARPLEKSCYASPLTSSQIPAYHDERPASIECSGSSIITRGNLLPLPLVPPRNQTKQTRAVNKPFAPPSSASPDTWFGQPTMGSQQAQPSYRKKRPKNHGSQLCTNDVLYSSQRPALAAAERLMETRLHSENNTDIREFFTRNHGNSVEAYPCSRSVLDNSDSSQRRLIEPHDVVGRHRACVEQDDARSPSSARNPAPMQFNERADTSSNDLQTMRETFRAHEEHETALGSQSTAPVHQNRACIKRPDSNTSKPLRPRHCTITESGRTKSSRLPLERTLHEYRVQALALSVATSVASIIQTSQRLDMSSNSLAWSSPAEAVRDIFAQPVNQRSIQGWVIRLDISLGEQYGRIAGVDTRGQLHESIQRPLDARRIERDDESPVEERMQSSSTQAGDREPDFDLSQFVDLDAGAVAKTAEKDGHGYGQVETDGEERTDVEDEMLLDL